MITGAQTIAYFVAFLSTAAATALLIAPSAYHRIQWRQRDKERMLRTSTKLSLLGLAFLTVAIASTIFVVTDVRYDTAWAVVISVIAGVVFALLWFVSPTTRRIEKRSLPSARTHGGAAGDADPAAPLADRFRSRPFVR